MSGGIPTECTVCGAELLNPHELTGICREDKMIQRNERLAAAEAEVQAERRQQAVTRALAKIDNQSRQPAGAATP
jgi:hypothetical protein